MRRSFILVLAVGLFVGLLAGPASATKPIHISDSNSFPDVNVCTGEEHTVNLDFDIAVRENNRNVVITIQTELWTSDGWSGRGGETIVEGPGSVNAHINLRVANDDGKGAYTVKGRFLLDFETGEAKSDRFAITCTQAA